MEQRANVQANVIPLKRTYNTRYKRRCDDASRLIIGALSRVNDPDALTQLICALDVLQGGPKPDYLAIASGKEPVK